MVDSDIVLILDSNDLIMRVKIKIKIKFSLLDGKNLLFCKYGVSCFCKNLLYFVEFLYFIVVVKKVMIGSGSDIDFIDFDDEKDKVF